MADRAPDIGRICPSCQRRVPRTVAKCRCGEPLPLGDAADADAPTNRSSFLILGALIAATLGMGYWTFVRPSTPPSQVTATSAPAAQAAGTASPAAAVAAGDTGPRDVSPEQRAWDAQAKLEAGVPEAQAAAPPAVPAESGMRADTGQTPTLEDMVDRAMASVVLVETTTGRGSAFYVQNDTLITNVHVVQQDAYVTLRRMDGSSVSARVHTRAPGFDIAVLKVAQPSASQPFLQMGSVSTVKPGQEVIVIGSALGMLQNSVSRGIVSGVRNSGGVTLVQSDAAANPGNSGGPMLDRTGRVIGILTAGFTGQEGLNFAVSIDHARDILAGRQANLGAGQPGLANIQPAGQGGGSAESDRRQQQGEQDFLRRVESAEQATSQLDADWQRFRSQCYTTPLRGSFDREWFAMFTPGAIPGDAAAGCVQYFQAMQTEMNKFRDFMRGTLDQARRANVLPGTIRDTLRARRLNFDW
jgi:S1-C subfamily serine protease